MRVDGAQMYDDVIGNSGPVLHRLRNVELRNGETKELL